MSLYRQSWQLEVEGRGAGRAWMWDMVRRGGGREGEMERWRDGEMERVEKREKWSKQGWNGQREGEKQTWK